MAVTYRERRRSENSTREWGSFNYLSQSSVENTYLVKSLRQARPCLFCHDGSFDRASLRVAYLPCEARPPLN